MVSLPSFPKVSSKEDLVIIEYEDGTRYVWGSEGNPENAKRVAQELDVEMKLYAYINETANVFLDNIQESITSIADDAIITELLNEALYQRIRKSKNLIK